MGCKSCISSEDRKFVDESSQQIAKVQEKQEEAQTEASQSQETCAEKVVSSKRSDVIQLSQVKYEMQYQNRSTEYNEYDLKVHEVLKDGKSYTCWQLVTQKFKDNKQFDKCIANQVNVNDPCLVQIIEIFKSLLSIYIVTDHVRLRTLQSELQQRKAFTEQEIQNVAQGLIQGISSLHSSNLSHLFVCPQNIYIDNEFKVRLLTPTLQFALSLTSYQSKQ